MIQKVLLGLRWSAGLKFTGQLITWSITVLVMRLLSPQDYGLMGMAGVTITYLSMINELGLGAALIQKQTLDDALIRRIFGVLLVINFGLFFISSLAAPWCAHFFNEQRLIPIIRVLSLKFLLASFAIVPQSLLIRDMRFKGISLVDLCSAIAGSLTTLPLALAGFGVWSLVWGSLALSVCRTVGLNFIKPCHYLPLLSFKKIGPSISFGSYVTITRLLYLLYTQSDIIITGKLLGKEALGYYSIALNLATLPMNKVSGIINQVAFPAFATLQGNTQVVAHHFLKSVRIMSLLAFPVLWGISSIAPQLVDILIGKKWDLAIVPLQVLSFVIPLRMVSNLMNPALLGIGRPDINMCNVITASLLLPFGFLVGNHWGIVGVSLAWATIFPIVFLINLSRVSKVFRICILNVINAMLKPILASVAMYIIVVMINVMVSGFDPILRLTMPSLGGLMVYCGIILLIDVDGYHEIFGLLRSRS